MEPYYTDEQVSYAEFLARKESRIEKPGSEVAAADVHPLLHPWQNELVRWAVRTSRAAIWAGSELYVSVKLGRRAIGIELKPSYWRTAVDNLTELESQMDAPSLFDVVEL